MSANISTREFEHVELTHLHIIDVGEEQLQDVEELGFLTGEGLTGENLEEVSEIVSGVEREPHDVVEKNNPGRDQQRGELGWTDAVFFVLLELNSRISQKVDAVLSVHILATERMINHGH